MIQDTEAFLAERAGRSEARLSSFRRSLLAHMGDAPGLLGGHTSVYATGSGGRGELSEHSDLDVFVVRRHKPASTLDAVQIQAAIVRALSDTGFPPPSRDGAFLRMHTSESLVGNIGKPEDDAENTFTARMLLLLESRPIAGTAYDGILLDVVSAYWKNYELHPADYLPIVLVNDIVRYWRILLLNYESKNVERERELPATHIKAERRLRSYKLRFSRCTTCYSALLALLALSKRHGHVKAEDVLAMVREAPTTRLARVARSFAEDAELGELVADMRARYAEFLRETGQSKDALDRLFSDPVHRRARLAEGDAFGDLVFSLVARLGEKNRLYRYLVV